MPDVISEVRQYLVFSDLIEYLSGNRFEGCIHVLSRFAGHFEKQIPHAVLRSEVYTGINVFVEQTTQAQG
jgi:hypothetical protein